MITFFQQHLYLMSALIFFITWVILFLINKKHRREILTISLVTLVLGIFVEQMHFTDWWRPHFVFNTFIHIEDIIFGFSGGGTVIGFYYLIERFIYIPKTILVTRVQKIILVISFLVILFGFFYILHIHSFWSTTISLLIPIIIFIVKDPKSLCTFFVSGIFVTFFAFWGYQMCIALNPNFVSETYLLDHLTGILFYGIPIEELGWFFLVGFGLPAHQKILLPRK